MFVNVVVAGGYTRGRKQRHGGEDAPRPPLHPTLAPHLPLQTLIGRPYIPGATVLVAVEEHFRDGKVHVFKRQPRKRYRK